MHWDSIKLNYSKSRPWSGPGYKGPRGAGSGRVGAGSGRVGGGVGLKERQSGAEWKPSRAE